MIFYLFLGFSDNYSKPFKMANRFQKSLEAATDQTLVEPNWEGILECVDMIRGGEVPIKDAVKSIQRRYHSQNPHISHHALLILEACVKNCGKKFVLEVATKEFMDDMKNLVISNPPDNVRDKVLELIQCWTSAFKGIPEYKIVEDTHSLLKMNGFEFPPIDEAKAMFLADSAPDWAEGDNCFRCRVEFGFLTRKHHCRACGQIFCDKCSNKQMLLPQFGIEKKVRVCESCFDKRQAQTLKSKGTTDDKATFDAGAREKAIREAEEKEQEELQLALAISQSEAEAKEREKWSSSYSYNGVNKTADTNVASNVQPQQFEIVQPKAAPVREEFSLSGMGDDQEQPFDSMLAKYLDRDYWERKRKETEEQTMRATAPPPSEISVSVSSSVSQRQPQTNGLSKNEVAEVYNSKQNDSLSTLQMEESHQSIQQVDGLAQMYAAMNVTGAGREFPKEPNVSDDEEEVAETSAFCRALKERVETMSTRMRSNQLRGRSIVNDSAIHSLFSQLTDAHANVLQRITSLEGQREHYERLQDHLASIQEARQAVNSLREDNERKRQEILREEQNRRQAQMRQKVELMRHKKHELLLYERQAAIHRFQEHERQILQQRVVQQKSPQTVGGIGVASQNNNPTVASQQPQMAQIPQRVSPANNSIQYSSMPPQNPHQQFVMPIAQPQQDYNIRQQQMGPPTYHSPQMPYPMPQPMIQPQQPHPSYSPHIMYNQQLPLHQGLMAMPNGQQNVFPPHHYQMSVYPPQQYITNQHHIAPQAQQHPPPVQAQEQPREQPKAIEVAEDLLISFD